MPSKTVSKKSVKSVKVEKKISKAPATVKKKTAPKAIAKPISSYGLLRKSSNIIYENRRPFGYVLVVYYLLTIIFVRGASSSLNIVQLKDSYLVGLHPRNAFSSDASVLGHIIGSGVSGVSGNGGLVQGILFIVFSLVFIWMLREIMANNKATARDGLYKSQGPLVKFVLIFVLLFLEFIPILVGLFLYTTVFGDGIAAHMAEKVVWVGIIVLLILLTFYLVTSTLFALYMTTLPDVKPIQALRSSWGLVKNKRTIIFRKLFFLTIFLLASIGLLSIAAIALVPRIADFIYYGLTVSALLFAHSYLYNLYRDQL